MIARSSIREKLITAIMLTSVTVVMLTGGVLIAHEIASVRAWMVRALKTRADILGANSTAALAFQNPDDASSVMAALAADPSMRAAALYDHEGRLFATFFAEGKTMSVPHTLSGAGHRFTTTSLVLHQPVIEHGTRLGTVFVMSDLRQIDERIRVHVIVVVLAVLGSIGVAFALSTWFQRSVTVPLNALAVVARNVSERRDYSLRAQATTDDELGLLTSSINDMLDAIQQRDVALQAGAERMRAILDSSLDAIVTMDDAGRIVQFNPAAESLFGYTREQAIGAPLADLIIPAGKRDQHRNGLERYLATGQAAVLDRRLELMVMRATGEEFPIEVAITRIENPGSSLFTGFIRDITERKRAENEIRQLNADLERRVLSRTAELAASNRELEAFSYSVSHDLRAPLRAIDGFSKALIEDCADQITDVGRGHISRVVAATQRMSQLIDDLLDLARVSRAELRRQRVDLTAIAKDIATNLTQSQPQRHASVQIAEGLLAEGDPQLLRVALENLLTNAWKFTEKHESATIEVGQKSEGNGPVYFVRDDGSGFDMAHGDLLFAPFQRLHRQSDFPGTGVGLATVQRIIHRHGGRVWGEGAVERGAVFYFTLGEEAHA